MFTFSSIEVIKSSSASTYSKNHSFMWDITFTCSDSAAAAHSFCSYPESHWKTRIWLRNTSETVVVMGLGFGCLLCRKGYTLLVLERTVAGWRYRLQWEGHVVCSRTWRPRYIFPLLEMLFLNALDWWGNNQCPAGTTLTLHERGIAPSGMLNVSWRREIWPFSLRIAGLYGVGRKLSAVWTCCRQLLELLPCSKLNAWRCSVIFLVREVSEAVPYSIWNFFGNVKSLKTV